MRSKRPNSISGKIRAFLAAAGGRPVSTSEVADHVGLGGSAASAYLCQLRCRGEAKNGRRVYGAGHHNDQSTWLPV